MNPEGKGQDDVTQGAKELRKVRSAKRKRALALEITDNEQLIAAFAYHVGRLRPGELMSPGPMPPACQKRGDRRARRPYLAAVRRCLAIRSWAGGLYRLPGNYLQRLRSIGLLPLVDLAGAERQRFEELNADLVVDDAVKAFSDDHQILERVKLYLETRFPQAKNETKREPGDDDSQEELDPDEPLCPAMGSPKPPPGSYQPPGQISPTPKAPAPEIKVTVNPSFGCYVLSGQFTALRKLSGRFR